MLVEVNQLALDWFETHNISFDNRFQSRIVPGNRIYFRDGLKVEPYIGIHSGYTIPSMGFMSYTNSWLPESIRVGRYCSIANNVSFPAYRHPIEHLSTSIFTHDYSTDLVIRFIRDNRPDYDNFFPNPQKDEISIGHDVWIGQDVAILPGVTIGTGAVVAARSVVTAPVLPYEIVGGNPAKVIRRRFSDEVINELLLCEWWKYKFTDFHSMTISDPEIFLKQFRNGRVLIDEYRPPLIILSELTSLCRVIT